MEWKTVGNKRFFVCRECVDVCVHGCILCLGANWQDDLGSDVWYKSLPLIPPSLQEIKLFKNKKNGEVKAIVHVFLGFHVKVCVRR